MILPEKLVHCKVGSLLMGVHQTSPRGSIWGLKEEISPIQEIQEESERNHTCHIDKLHPCEQPSHEPSVPPFLLLQNHTHHIDKLQPCEQPPHDSKVPSSSLLRNHTRHIDNLHSCEQPPHDSSVPPSLLLRNYTPHIANSFCCKCTNKSSVSPILSPIKPM